MLKLLKTSEWLLISHDVVTILRVDITKVTHISLVTLTQGREKFRDLNLNSQLVTSTM